MSKKLYFYTMNKLLVPTDFSDASYSAIRYAVELAKIFKQGIHKNAEIILLNVYNVPVVDPLGVETGGEIIDSFREQAEKNIKELVAEVEQQATGIKVRGEVRMGFAVPEILEFAEEENVRFIVISHQGETSLIDKVFGSIALGIITDATIPVLSVPSKREYSPIRKTFFSTNILTLDVYSLTSAINFCVDIDSGIHFFTIIDGHYPFSANKVKKVYSELMNTLKCRRWNLDIEEKIEEIVRQETMEYHYGPSFAVIETKELVEGIKDYVKQQRPDLLILSKRHRNFLQSFFSKSISLEVVRDSDLPILILPSYVKA